MNLGFGVTRPGGLDQVGTTTLGGHIISHTLSHFQKYNLSKCCLWRDNLLKILPAHTYLLKLQDFIKHYICQVYYTIVHTLGSEVNEKKTYTNVHVTKIVNNFAKIGIGTIFSGGGGGCHN